MKSTRTDMPRAAITALERGNKIEAIKILREHSNVGLAEAKSIVEVYVKEHPEIEGRVKERASDATYGVKFGLSAVVVFALAYFYFLT